VSEAAVPAATEAMLALRRTRLDAGARPLGWKVGFNVPAAQEKLGIEAPLAGFLSSAGLLSDGSTLALDGRPAVAEPEVAVEIGDDGRSIAALLPALEVADPPDLSWGLERILAGNIFHRAVAFGPRVETGAPGAARILVNGDEREQVPAERTGAHLEAMVDAVAARLAAAGASLSPGERIITGVLAPPPAVEAGDVVRLELDSLGAVELRFS
jgi:2-keto-4-pentenoate hydratase